MMWEVRYIWRWYGRGLGLVKYKIIMIWRIDSERERGKVVRCGRRNYGFLGIGD